MLARHTLLFLSAVPPPRARRLFQLQTYNMYGIKAVRGQAGDCRAGGEGRGRAGRGRGQRIDRRTAAERHGGYRGGCAVGVDAAGQQQSRPVPGLQDLHSRRLGSGAVLPACISLLTL